VGKFLEFRVVRDPIRADLSQVPDIMIPNPDLSAVPISAQRVFEFGYGASQTINNSDTSFTGPWGVATNGGQMLNASFGRVSAAPKYGTREVWTLINGGGGWDHPVNIHFEEGQVLARNGSAANVPAWEKGRKDVYRLRPGGSITLTMQFRDWGGMFMEHCHNTVHEDNAMLLRWEINGGGAPFLAPLPTPICTPQGVTFIPPDEVLASAFTGGTGGNGGGGNGGGSGRSGKGGGGGNDGGGDAGVRGGGGGSRGGTGSGSGSGRGGSGSGGSGAGGGGGSGGGSGSGGSGKGGSGSGSGRGGNGVGSGRGLSSGQIRLGISGSRRGR